MTAFPLHERVKFLILLTSLCDQRYQNSQRLVDLGYSRCAADLDEHFHFCASEVERERHKSIDIEFAKTSILNSAAWYAKKEEAQQMPVHKSALLEKLHAENDLRNGCSPAELEKRYLREEAWYRSFIDPCERRRAMEQPSSPEDVGRRHALRRKSTMTEAAAHRADFLGASALESLSHLQVAEEAAAHYGGQLGFQPVRKKWKWPAFVKQVGDIDLVWTVNDPLHWLMGPNVSPNDYGLHSRIETMFFAAHGSATASSLQKAVKDRPSVIIHYPAFCATNFRSYYCFFEKNELAYIIKAHFALISMVLNDVEKCILMASQKRQNNSGSLLYNASKT